MDHEELRIDIINSSVMRKTVYDLIPENASRILDVGCGRGGILLRLQRDKNCTELFGVDIDKDAILKLDQFIDHASASNIETEEILPKEFEGHFNYIIMHDVVEHLFDPWFTLTRIRPFLAENGVAIISTPNLHYWKLQHEIMSGRFSYGPGLMHAGHLRWYTPSSLLTVLEIGGFSTQEYYQVLVDAESLQKLGTVKEIKTVQFPPAELQDKYPDLPIYSVEYPKDIRAYYPTFYTHKLIAVCTKGNLIWKPAPLTYNCALLHKLTKEVNNPFDIFNPLPTRLLKLSQFQEETYKPA